MCDAEDEKINGKGMSMSECEFVIDPDDGHFANLARYNESHPVKYDKEHPVQMFFASLLGLKVEDRNAVDAGWVPTDWPCECTLVGVHCGKTVCAESAGRRPLAASRNAYGGDWEKFTIIRNDDGSFSLKAAVNGKYVSVMPNKGGRLLAQGEKVDLWEKFDLRKVEGETGFYTLWSHVAKKYVSVDENKENVLIANRDSPDNWEWFCIRPLSGMTESCDSVLGRGLIGWNLGNALDANPDEEGWGNPRVSYELIRAVRDKGFGIVRIPVTWHCHTGQDGKIDPRWMARVAEVVGYAISVGLKVILNVHHDETAYIHAEDDGLEDGQNWLENVWRQIAVYFKDYGRSQLVFETMNEPRIVGSPNEWTEGTKRVCQYINRLNSSIVKIIRASGGENAHRLIMCPGHAAVVPSGDFVLPQDDHIAVSVHLYCPYAFAMDAEHGHADFTEEDKKVILEKFSQLSRRFVANGIPVVVGETGAINRGNHESRARWAQYFVSTATEFGLTCVIWDNGNLGEGKETFGLIDRRKLSWTYENVIDAAMAGIQHR